MRHISQTSNSVQHTTARFLIVPVVLLMLASVFAGLSRTGIVLGSNQDIRKLSQFVQTSNAPAMKTFREGRDLIEEEEWAKAAAKFDGFIARYPQDKDSDAALYWLAYSLKRQAKFRETADRLARLMKNYPRSRWAEEARAMMTEIAPQIGERRVIEDALGKENKEKEEIKIVALQSLFEASPERAMDYVGEILKADSTAGRRLKEAAVSLMGSRGGPRARPMLLAVARSQPDPRLRRVAIHRLGEEGGEAVLDDLTKLYESERDIEVKKQILHSISHTKSPRARTNLLTIASSPGENVELRKTAIHRLGERENASAFDDLARIYDGESNVEIKSQILHSLARLDRPRAQTKLLDVARSGGSDNLRGTAIHLLVEGNDPQRLEFMIGLYDAEKNLRIKRLLLHHLGESRQKSALRKLMDIARNDPSVELRKQAVQRLGRSKDHEALKFIEDLLK